MIVVDTENVVVGCGYLITRCDINDEVNIIKVRLDVENDDIYYCIGTQDRDQYIIYEDTNVPDLHKQYWFYVRQHPDGGQYYEYIEIPPPPRPDF